MRFRPVLTCVCVALLSAQAAAQTDAPVDDAAREQARAVFAEGASALEAGNCQSASVKFQQAYDLVHEASILYNLATAEAECGNVVDAAAHYQTFVDEVRTGRSARFRADARRQLPAVRRRIGHLALRIEGVQPGDVVIVDDHHVEIGALADVPVNVGEHVIVVRRDAAEWARVTATTTEGQTLEVPVTLTEPQVVADAEPTPTEQSAASSQTSAPGCSRCTTAEASPPSPLAAALSLLAIAATSARTRLRRARAAR